VVHKAARREDDEGKKPAGRASFKQFQAEILAFGIFRRSSKSSILRQKCPQMLGSLFRSVIHARGIKPKNFTHDQNQQRDFPRQFNVSETLLGNDYSPREMGNHKA